MVQNPIWIRRNQGNSSTKEITTKIDASCHAEIPISIYLRKSLAASDISIIGADWVHPTLMRINSGRPRGMGTAAITGTSLSNLKQWESWFFPGVVPKGSGRRGQPAAGCPLAPREVWWCCLMPWARQCSGDGAQDLGTMEGPCSCQGLLPTAQPISSSSNSRGGSAWPGMNLQWIIPMPNVVHSHLCLVLVELLQVTRRAGSKGTRTQWGCKESKNQKYKIKQGRVGITRERTTLIEVHGGQTALEN